MKPSEASVIDPSGQSAETAPAVSAFAPLSGQAVAGVAPGATPSAEGAGASVAGHASLRPCYDILQQRADFLRAASALRLATPGFLLQARERHAQERALPGLIRVGFTCSKKVGNAVTRNRAKRRLREIARLGMAAGARPGWDYVLIGRPGVTVTRDFSALQADLARALRDVHSGRAKTAADEPPRGPRRGKGRGMTKATAKTGPAVTP